jgi:hypothetical protein
VTSSAAFTSGAGNNDNNNIYDGTGTVGNDEYSKSMRYILFRNEHAFSQQRIYLTRADCYFGSAAGFPDKSKWIEFDAMWNFSKPSLTSSCSDLGIGSCSNGAGAFDAGDSGEQIGQIWNAIQQIAETSLVDHRFILATILQEVSYLS